MVGDGAQPRPFQIEAIEAVAIRRARLLLVQRTGWGKSAVYFIATRLLRDRGAGPTLLVSPLLALMRNQMEMAARVGVRAATINSTNPEDFADIVERLERDEIDLLLVSPERFNNERFRTEMLPVLARGAGLLVIDEAHCISDWGHDFRPDYRRIVRVLELLPRGAPVLCTTATANDRVVEDVVAQLGRDLEVMRGSLDRESLSLSVLEMPDPAKRMAWLAERIPSFDGSGIVYTLTVADTTRVAGFLRSRGISAHAYSGDTEHEERLELEERLLANDLKCLGGDLRVGDGVRQARSRVRGALTSPPGRRSPTTSRSVEQAVRWNTRRPCCCRVRRTATSRTTSSRPRSLPSGSRRASCTSWKRRRDR